MSTRLTILRRGDGAFARCDCCGEPTREVEAAVRILCSGCGRYLCEACSRQCRHAAQDHRHWDPMTPGLVQLTSDAVTDHRVGQPDVTDLRTWGAHERVSVRRAAAGGGQAMMAAVASPEFP